MADAKRSLETDAKLAYARNLTRRNIVR